MSEIAGIKVLSVCEFKAIRGSLFEAWSRSEYSLACFTCCQEFYCTNVYLPALFNFIYCKPCLQFFYEVALITAESRTFTCGFVNCVLTLHCWNSAIRGYCLTSRQGMFLRVVSERRVNVLGVYWLWRGCVCRWLHRVLSCKPGPRGLTFTCWRRCGLSLSFANRACPLLFILLLCLFLSLWPFQLYFI